MKEKIIYKFVNLIHKKLDLKALIWYGSVVRSLIVGLWIMRLDRNNVILFALSAMVLPCHFGSPHQFECDFIRVKLLIFRDSKFRLNLIGPTKLYGQIGLCAAHFRNPTAQMKFNKSDFSITVGGFIINPLLVFIFSDYSSSLKKKTNEKNTFMSFDFEEWC